MTPVDPAQVATPGPAERPAKPADKPQRERHPRRDAAPREHQPRKHEAPKHEPKAERPKHEKPRHDNKPAHEKPRHEKVAHEKRHRREDREEAPSSGPGMGANTPAFLLRPVPQHLIKRKKETETA